MPVRQNNLPQKPKKIEAVACTVFLLRGKGSFNFTEGEGHSKQSASEAKKNRSGGVYSVFTEGEGQYQNRMKNIKGAHIYTRMSDS